MAYFHKTQIFVILAASFGAAYSQSVVIDSGNIRVDASPGSKATVTTKGDKGRASKKSKTEVTAGDSESTEVIEGKTVLTNVGKSDRVTTVGNGGKVFVNSDFSGQDLSRGNYAGASFTNVEAVGVNFRGVDLSRAVMTNMDLSKADLRGANLVGAQMTNVEWNGALLDGAIWVDGRRCGPASLGRCK
nr:pentapeptide repeat-containing protein [Rhodoferax sp.]